ncbi:hypothetical protein [Parasitella parasitica]|uniref:Uncharacterized protein n=1 Tax=Parasitella parasitica TaxID=35722 RepID=A0A0B7NQ84_9FUNG|nr:hypothetical protein [Parasitella parasitica]
MTKSTGVGRGRPKVATNVPKKAPGHKDIRKMFTKKPKRTNDEVNEFTSNQVTSEDPLLELNIASSSSSGCNINLRVDDLQDSDLTDESDDDFIDDENFLELILNRIVIEDEPNGYPKKDSLEYNYLEAIKQRCKKNIRPVEYQKGAFWVNPPLPCFALQGEAVIYQNHNICI